MAWRSMYGNVELGEQDDGRRSSSKQRPQSVDDDIYEEESIYEPIRGLDVTEKRNRDEKTCRVPDNRPKKGRMQFVTLSALLAVALLLIFILLSMGLLKYSALTAELQEVTSENAFLRSTVSGPFLIFNKDHNKCAEPKDNLEVTAADCNHTSMAQQFQWISGGRLLHVDTRMCLWAPKVVNKLTVRLNTCSERDVRQQWECPNGTLLAIKGADLYFNYGNNRNKVVMLYTGTGPWSQWIVHGTQDNVCSWSYEASSPCRRGWTFFQDHCYYFSRLADSWEHASQWCISQASLLVTIGSSEEQAYIADAIRPRPFWLGLTDQKSEETWEWVDGSVLSDMRNWGQNEPNGFQKENCASMDSAGDWRDFPCEEKFPWICERKA